jgi:hypothetical protein
MTLRAFLSSVLGTAVHHVRFPKLYDEEVKQALQSRQLLIDPEERKKDRKWRLPPAGDKFKDFAFIVVSDPAGEGNASSEAEEEPSGSPVEANEEKSADETEGDPKEQARRYCLKLLPMCVLENRPSV